MRKIYPACPYSILHVLLIFMKLPACTLFHPANIVRLLKFFKYIPSQNYENHICEIAITQYALRSNPNYWFQFYFEKIMQKNEKIACHAASQKNLLRGSDDPSFSTLWKYYFLSVFMLHLLHKSNTIYCVFLPTSNEWEINTLIRQDHFKRRCFLKIKDTQLILVV